MGLMERMEKTRPARPAKGSRGGTATTPEENVVRAPDPLVVLKERTQRALMKRLGSRLYDASLTPELLEEFVQQELTTVVDEDRAPLTAAERRRLVLQVSQDVLGYGPIQGYLSDPDVTEVMVNGTNAIYVERGGRLERTEARYLSDDHVRRVIERIVAEVGRRIDESSPMVDARLPDGSRVNAIIPPLAVSGPTITIRKFSHDPYGVEDLVGFGTFSADMADFLAACVEGRLNVLVTGGTGTGKTTLLNVLSSFIPEDERIVTIEDAVELQLHQDHVVTLESRPPNIEGRGQVTIRDLVRNALRMRPDRIIVGEVRGAESLDMLQAMNTGHEGSLSTVHANSPRDAMSRLETMVLMAGMDLPLRAIRDQIASAIDVIVHLSRGKDGRRRVVSVAEVHGMEGDVITLQDIYRFERRGTDDDGIVTGEFRATGIRPAFVDRLADSGVDVPAEVFGDAATAVDAELDTRRRRR
jgi:pilus assembly protein CpaF